MRGYAGILRMVMLAALAMALAGSAITLASTSRHPLISVPRRPLLLPSEGISPPRMSLVLPPTVEQQDGAGISGHLSPPRAPLTPRPGQERPQPRAIPSGETSPPQTMHAPETGDRAGTEVSGQRGGVEGVGSAHARLQAAATGKTTPVIVTAEEATLLHQLTHAPVLPTYRLYTTQPGDTVESIAQRYHDVAWLVRRRNGGLWKVTPGERIQVWQWPFDTPRWTTRTYQTDQPQSYTIQAGDSLWSIATRLHTDMATLASQNGIASGSTIYAGQRLVLHHYTMHQQRIWVPAVAASSLPTGLLLTDMANLVRTDAALVKALVWHESGWRMVKGASGEIGMVQIMPGTAAWVQRALIGYPLDPRVPANNALLGTVLLAYYLDIDHHDTHRALALYHSGNTVPDKRNGTYIRAVLGLRTYFYHHPRVGF